MFVGHKTQCTKISIKSTSVDIVFWATKNMGILQILVRKNIVKITD